MNLNLRRSWTCTTPDSANSHMVVLADGSVATTPNGSATMPIIEVFDSGAAGSNLTPVRRITNVNAGVSLSPYGAPRCWGLASDSTGSLYYLDMASPPVSMTYRVLQFAPGADGDAAPIATMQLGLGSSTQYPVDIANNVASPGEMRHLLKTDETGYIAVLMCDSVSPRWWVEFYSIPPPTGSVIPGLVTPIRKLSLPYESSSGWGYPIIDPQGNFWVRSLTTGAINFYPPIPQGNIQPINTISTVPGTDPVGNFAVDPGRGVVHALSSSGNLPSDFICDFQTGNPKGQSSMGPGGPAAVATAYLYWIPQLQQVAFLYTAVNQAYGNTFQGALFYNLS